VSSPRQRLSPQRQLCDGLQLAVANDRAEHADRRADDERRRADDAVAAERIAAREAAQLLGEIDRRLEWSLWRRLRWALRP
jgi:hypothetical protein